MLGMQSPEGPSAPGNRLMGSKMGGESTGFSHGAFTSNNNSFQGFGDRNSRRVNIPSINTSARDPFGGHNTNDVTPGTAFDMNYTPLLPSGLLLGSPFQPGSPATFASPHVGNFGAFSRPSNTLHQSNQPQHVNSPTQAQNGPMSPQMYQNMASPDAYSSSQMLGGPQSPMGGFPNLGGAPYGTPSASVQLTPGIVSGTSRTVYLGNIPAETTAEEILSHVRSGQIESVRFLPDKNCAFISFLDSSSATHFHSDAILKKLSIKGHDIKIGWGKPSQVPTSVALAVQQSQASRNVYLGNLPEDISEEELREDLGKFGPIDTVKLVREKAIGFVHFLSISNAVKAVAQLPQEPKWQPPRRVYYGKDRCAYVSKTQQQNAAQYLGIAPGYAHVLNGADRDLISNALAQQSVAAAAVATTAGGVNNLGNRTVYLGNIHPETTIEEICNVVRGGLLHHIRYIPDKHICFVTFIDPTSAASFYALSNIQGLMIHNRRLKIGWGKHSGALPPAIALAVSGGASRNVYIGNLDETWSEERLRQDFSEYGEIELVNTLREKSCAFVNFTNIANAIKAIEAVRGKEEYKRFKVNFGKDRCGNPPRQTSNSNGQQPRMFDGPTSPPNMNGYPANLSQGGSQPSPTRPALSPAPGSASSLSHNGHQVQRQGSQNTQTPSTVLNAGANNPLTIYLNHVSAQQAQEQDLRLNEPLSMASLQQQQAPNYASQPSSIFGNTNQSLDLTNGNPGEDLINRQGSIGSGLGGSTSSTTVGGLLAPANARGVHSRAVSLPAFSQEGFNQNGTAQPLTRQNVHHQPQGSFSGFSSVFAGGLGHGLSGFGNGGFGLSIQNEGVLPGWAEEEVGAK
ncbi:MAG: hypothetical protein Q9227_008714 [Pyrenula ochraceoflavens]